MKIDFHVHTKYSPDSIIDLKKLKKQSEKTGVIPAITDHDTVAGHKEAKEINLTFIPGEEIRTSKGDLIALFIEEPIKRGIDFSEALDLIKDQGGLSYLPHMYDFSRAGVIPENEDIAKIDIIEVFNARCLIKELNSKAVDFAEKHKKLKACGSDSHFQFEFGHTYCEIEDIELDPKKLLKALKKSKLTTRNAPFFVRGPTLLLKTIKKHLTKQYK